MQSIVRAFALLEAMSQAPGEIGIAQLAKRAGLHVSTTHRLLATLVALGYARQSPETGRYAVGARALQLAEAYGEQTDLRGAARPVLERLSRETGETANLVVLEGHEALYVDKAESAQNLRIFSRIGRRTPLYCTAVGKVLLAWRPPDEVRRLLAATPIERLTRRTITDAQRLTRELLRVRQQGYALDLEECEEGARCIATPVRVASGEVVAAISLSGPSIRMHSGRLRELIPMMLAAAAEVSGQLG
ncbi:MAG: IclR family transcriptional regulator [Candidatus Methylomirabilales bacterium]